MKILNPLVLLSLFAGPLACRDAAPPAPPISPPAPPKKEVAAVIPELAAEELTPFVNDLAEILAKVDAAAIAQASEQARHRGSGVVAAYEKAFKDTGRDPEGGKACQTRVAAVLAGFAATRESLATAGIDLPRLVAAAHRDAARALVCTDEIVQATHDAQMAQSRGAAPQPSPAPDEGLRAVGSVGKVVKELRATYASCLQRLLGAVSPGVRYHTVAAITATHEGIPPPAISSLMTRLNLTRASERQAGVRQAMTERIKELRAAAPRPPHVSHLPHPKGAGGENGDDSPGTAAGGLPAAMPQP